jgi:hypothetical protein
LLANAIKQLIAPAIDGQTVLRKPWALPESAMRGQNANQSRKGAGDDRNVASLFHSSATRVAESLFFMHKIASVFLQGLLRISCNMTGTLALPHQHFFSSSVRHRQTDDASSARQHKEHRHESTPIELH